MNSLKILVPFYLLLSLMLFAEVDSEIIDKNNLEQNNSEILKELEKRREEERILEKKLHLEDYLGELNRELSGDNIWLKRYANYYTYKNMLKEIDTLSELISELESKKRLSNEDKEILTSSIRKRDVLKSQADVLGDYEVGQFKDLLHIEDIVDIPKVQNPIAVLEAFSFIKTIKLKQDQSKRNSIQLDNALKTLIEKRSVLDSLLEIEPNRDEYIEQKEYIDETIDEFEQTQNVYQTTLTIYNKKSQDVINQLSEDIKNQGIKALYILAIVLVLFSISLLIKLATRKYVNDNERLYTANKIVNFINVTLIVFVLLFAYLENVSYLVTVLGFASAGLAIAMKDLFMSILGWMVIVLGGSIHVGDRVKVKKDGLEYVGDVLDVSLLRITIHEDITLTTYLTNRRAGRIIFIPNNYIFTTLISNYTHASMKTVWDGIDVTITFDSNFKKAMQIAKDISKKYSKGYTDITRKQLNMLRDKYSLRNTSVEPRIFVFLEPYGIRISFWYLTNAYSTLVLRSTISSEFIESINKEGDIKIAYPTNAIKMDGSLDLRQKIDEVMDSL